MFLKTAVCKKRKGQTSQKASSQCSSVLPHADPLEKQDWKYCGICTVSLCRSTGRAVLETIFERATEIFLAYSARDTPLFLVCLSSLYRISHRMKDLISLSSTCPCPLLGTSVVQKWLFDTVCLSTHGPIALHECLLHNRTHGGWMWALFHQ